MYKLTQASQIVLFGASAWLAQKYLPWLRGAGVEDKVLYFCDNDVAKHGSIIAGYRVYPAKKILENPDALILIIAGRTSPIYRSVRDAGIANRVVCAPQFRHSFTKPLEAQDAARNHEFVLQNRSRLKSIYNLSDLYTEGAIEEIMRQRELDFESVVEPESVFEFDTQEHYFDDRFLAPRADITFVDCGAFIGDSCMAIKEHFGKRLKKVIAFEPFPDTYRKLAVHLSAPEYGSVECALINAACGDKMTIALMDENIEPAANTVTNSGPGVPIQVCAIDSLDLDVLGDVMLKMDVEGGELQALKGAKEFITKHNPYMAICVYHKMEDVMQIPVFIYSVSEDYSFFLRGGGHTVCYAIPKRHFDSLIVEPPVV